MAEQEEIDFDNVKVTFPDGDVKKYPKPLLLSDLQSHPSLSSPDNILIMVNGEIKSFNAKINFGIAKVSPIKLDSYEGGAAYRRTLVQIFATAVHKLYAKEFNVIIHHGVNNGYLAKGRKYNVKNLSMHEHLTVSLLLLSIIDAE